MNCEQAEILLTAYVFGEARPDTDKTLEEHLAQCAACAAKLRDLRAAADMLKAAVGSAGAPALSPERQAALAALQWPEPRAAAGTPGPAATHNKAAGSPSVQIPELQPARPVPWRRYDRSRRRSPVRWIAGAAAVAALLLLVAGMLLPSLSSARFPARKSQAVMMPATTTGYERPGAYGSYDDSGSINVAQPEEQVAFAKDRSASGWDALVARDNNGRVGETYDNNGDGTVPSEATGHPGSKPGREAGRPAAPGRTEWKRGGGGGAGAGAGKSPAPEAVSPSNNNGNVGNGPGNIGGAVVMEGAQEALRRAGDLQSSGGGKGFGGLQGGAAAEQTAGESDRGKDGKTRFYDVNDLTLEIKNFSSDSIKEGRKERESADTFSAHADADGDQEPDAAAPTKNGSIAYSIDKQVVTHAPAATEQAKELRKSADDSWLRLDSSLRDGIKSTEQGGGQEPDSKIAAGDAAASRIDRVEESHRISAKPGDHDNRDWVSGSTFSPSTPPPATPPPQPDSGAMATERGGQGSKGGGANTGSGASQYEERKVAETQEKWGSLPELREAREIEGEGGRDQSEQNMPLGADKLELKEAAKVIKEPVDAAGLRNTLGKGKNLGKASIGGDLLEGHDEEQSLNKGFVQLPKVQEQKALRMEDAQAPQKAAQLQVDQTQKAAELAVDNSTPPDAAPEREKELLGQMNREGEIRRKANEQLAKDYLDSGKKRFDERRYEQAEADLQQSLAANPANTEARDALAMTRRLLGKTESGEPNPASESRYILDAKVNYQYTTLMQQVADSRALIANKNYPDAIAKLTEAKNLAKALTIRYDVRQQITDIDAMIQQAAGAQTKAMTLEEQQKREAAVRLADEEQQRKQTLQAVVRVNPFVMTQDDAQSTFALETDTGAYTLTRGYIRRGYLPPAHSVRVEEFVNAFDYAYSGRDNAFSIYATCAPSPFRPELQQLQVGVKAKRAGRNGRRPNNLVLCFDTSSSMGTPERLPLAQKAAVMLVQQLAPTDQISIVSYGTHAQLVLDATPIDGNRDQIIETINALQSGGSTNIVQGLGLAYQRIHKTFRSGSNNEVVLISDGIATVGPDDAKEILDNVKLDREQGIMLTCVGVGSGEYNDQMMEQLADKGDGKYVFLDTPEEAKHVFVDQFATLETVAKDAKIQVEFSPDAVRRYRLLGYENRDIADKDFRNDKVDAGEIGSGQTATALYELELVPRKDAPNNRVIGVVRVRYRDVETGSIEEIASPITAADILPPGAKTPPRFRLAAGAAQFAEILRGSSYAGAGSLKEIEPIMIGVCNELPLDQQAAELLDLIRKAQGLPRGQ